MEKGKKRLQTDISKWDSDVQHISFNIIDKKNGKKANRCIFLKAKHY